MVALSRNVAPKHAMEMLLTGDAISAEDAVRIGLINRVVAPGTERDAALALAHRIAAKSRHVVKIGKEAFYRQIDMDLAKAYDYAAEVMVENMMARDAAEGISAFIEKRTARVGGPLMTVAATLRNRDWITAGTMPRGILAGAAWGLTMGLGLPLMTFAELRRDLPLRRGVHDRRFGRRRHRRDRTARSVPPRAQRLTEIHRKPLPRLSSHCTAGVTR